MTITVSIGVALALTGYRLLHREFAASAVGGLVGVVAAAGIVALTGSAKDFFVIGI